MMTPTQREAHLRRLRFREAIAAKAERLNEARHANKTAQARAQPIAGQTAETAMTEPTDVKDERAWLTEICRSAPCREPPSLLPNVSIGLIQAAVARRFGVTVNDILSPRRAAGLVLARQVAMHLARQLTTRSMPEIGRHFGNRDHTTVLHALRKIERLEADDPKLAADLEYLRSKLS